MKIMTMSYENDSIYKYCPYSNFTYNIKNFFIYIDLFNLLFNLFCACKMHNTEIENNAHNLYFQIFRYQ